MLHRNGLTGIVPGQAACCRMGGLFANTTTGDVYHSLGFHVCSAVGCRVSVFVDDGAEFAVVHPWEGSGPEILYNFTITEEEPEWVRLQVKLLPPACLGHRKGAASI